MRKLTIEVKAEPCASEGCQDPATWYQLSYGEWYCPFHTMLRAARRLDALELEAARAALGQ